MSRATVIPRRPQRTAVPVVLGAALALAAAALPLVGPAPASGSVSTTAPRRMASGWLPYWQPGSALAAVTNNADLFSDASPFWYRATSATSVSPVASETTLDQMTATLHGKGVAVLPTVTETLDATGMAALLSSPTSRAAHVKALLAVVDRTGVDGLDLDYENMNFGPTFAKATVRADFPLLVSALQKGLASRGKRLSVTVPPRTSDTDPNWSVFDYPAIGARADIVRIMTYDYHWSGGSAGPIAPAPWVRSVAAYAVTRIPPGHVQLGMPLYGYDWFVSKVSGTCPSSAFATQSHTTQGSYALAGQKGVKVRYDSASGERTFTYTQRYTGATTSCVAKRVVWFEDTTSVDTKQTLVARYRLRGLAFWALGNQGSAVFPSVRRYAVSIAPRHARVTVSAVSEVAAGHRALVRGRLLVGGVAAAGAPVSLQASVSGGSWHRVATATTTSDGTVSFGRRPLRHTRWRLVAPATWLHLTDVSGSVLTRVRFAPTATLADPTVPVGGTYRMSGRLTPAVGGATVVRQRKLAGRWVDVGRTTARADGSYSFTVRLRRPGQYKLRVQVLGGSLRDRGASNAVVLTAG